MVLIVETETLINNGVHRIVRIVGVFILLRDRDKYTIPLRSVWLRALSVSVPAVWQACMNR